MDPLWLPMLILLFLAVGAGAAGISFARSGRRAMALKAWGVCLACGVLVFFSSRWTHKTPPPELLPAHRESTSIVLGGVMLRMEKSPHYVFAVDGSEFLALSVHRSMPKVSGVIGVEDRALAKLSENTFPLRRGVDLLPGKSEHAIWMSERGRRIFEVEVDDPSTIEITGEFFGSMYDEVALISCREGVRWGGGTLSVGSIVDLRGQKGTRVDFTRSGSVRVQD